MRKFTTIDAPVELVKAAYLDLEQWPQWRPGIRRVEILSREDGRARARLSQRIAGRYHDLVIDFEFRADGFHEHQRRGWLKKWIADWRFQPAPSGSGTVVSMDVNVEVGFLGLVVSRRRISRIVEGMFKETAARAERWVHTSATARRSTTEIQPGLARRIRIHRTVGGLEVWLDDQRFLALPAD